MKRAVLGLLCVAGCSSSPALPDGADGAADAAVHDLAFVFPPNDEAITPGCEQLNLCGDCDPGCMVFSLGPDRGKPFPLSSDPMPDPNEQNMGVGRDANGYLALDIMLSPIIAGWAANATDWGRGTVSRVAQNPPWPFAPRELARYFTVTCGSLPGGSTRPCDGDKTGCCAADDTPRWEARKVKMAQPPRQAVQLMANSPSRTGIDFDGSLWIANRIVGYSNAPPLQALYLALGVVIVLVGIAWLRLTTRRRATR